MLANPTIRLARTVADMSKYSARKVVIDGITFDSTREGHRYIDLRALVAAKQISDLELQVPYVLAPKVTLHDEKRARPAVRYLVDFRYRTHLDEVVCEDVKGIDTPMSRLKRHLMATVHGVQVRVVK